MRDNVLWYFCKVKWKIGYSNASSDDHFGVHPSADIGGAFVVTRRCSANNAIWWWWSDCFGGTSPNAASDVLSQLFGTLQSIPSDLVARYSPAGDHCDHHVPIPMRRRWYEHVRSPSTGNVEFAQSRAESRNFVRFVPILRGENYFRMLSMLSRVNRSKLPNIFRKANFSTVCYNTSKVLNLNCKFCKVTSFIFWMNSYFEEYNRKYQILSFLRF